MLALIYINILQCATGQINEIIFHWALWKWVFDFDRVAKFRFIEGYFQINLNFDFQSFDYVRVYVKCILKVNRENFENVEVSL